MQIMAWKTMAWGMWVGTCRRRGMRVWGVSWSQVVCKIPSATVLGTFKPGSGGSRPNSSTNHVEQNQIHISASLWCPAGVAASNQQVSGLCATRALYLSSQTASRAQVSCNIDKSQLKLGDLVNGSRKLATAMLLHPSVRAQLKRPVSLLFDAPQPHVTPNQYNVQHDDQPSSLSGFPEQVWRSPFPPDADISTPTKWSSEKRHHTGHLLK